MLKKTGMQFVPVFFWFTTLGGVCDFRFVNLDF